MKKAISIILTAALTLALAGCGDSGQPAASSGATGWEPKESIEFICQSSAGGGSDLMARAIGQQMQSEGFIKKPIVVDNRTGSGGVRAFSYTLSKDGNPYVWQTVNTNFFTAPITGNIDTDYSGYTILAVIGTDPNILCVSGDSKFNSFQEVMDAALADPMGLSIAIGSAGSSGSVASVLMETATGIKMTQVPFEGGGDGLVAVMGNQVDLSWQNMGEVMGAVESGLLKVLAIAAEERSSALPDVPTFKELGYDVVYEVPRAVAAPPNLPAEAVKFYAEAFTKLNASEKWQKDYLEPNFIFPKFAVGDEAVEILKEAHDTTYEVFKSMGLAAN